MQVDAPPDKGLVRCLLPLAEVAQAAVQPLGQARIAAAAAAAAAALPFVVECLGQ